MTGLPKPLLSKVIIGYCAKCGNDKKSLNFPQKICHLNLFFWTYGCQFWKNCRKLLAKCLTRFLLKVGESRQKTYFWKESRQKCSSGHVDCGPQVYRNSFSQIEKKSIVQNFVFFQNIPVDTEEADETILSSVFCSESKHGENLRTVSLNLLFPQNVPLEMMNANLTTLQV